MAIESITLPPFKEEIARTSHSWVLFFTKLYRNVLSLQPSMSSDNGNSDATLTILASNMTQLYNTPLTANRTVTLSATGAYNGAKFRVIRTANATGAFNLTVGSKSLTVGQWVDVEYDGSNWIETGFGSL